jgi:hypothetical protein
VDSDLLPSGIKYSDNVTFSCKGGKHVRDKAASKGPSFPIVSSSSSNSNPLAALTGLAGLGLSRSSVCGEAAGLCYLPVLGATLTRL